LQDAKLKTETGAAIEKDKKIFEPGEDPQFSVGELITPKKTDVCAGECFRRYEKNRFKKKIQIFDGIDAPNGQKNTEAIVVQNGEVKNRSYQNLEFRPGIYKVVVGSVRNGEPVTQEKEFAWGVLTVNTDKSTTCPGTARISRWRLLDDFGYTLLARI